MTEQKLIPKNLNFPSKPTRLRALIVDDDSIMLAIGGNMLDSLGFTVDSADGSVEALNYLGKYRYDLVMTDLIMSEMDGIELARRIRHVSKKTKIVIMTGTQLDQVREMTATETDCWLFKPFGLLQLEEAVNQFFPGDVGCQ